MRNEPVSFSRNEMVMVMHDQELEIERLRAKVEELQARLDDYEVKFKEAGTLADAAIQISGLFEAAQNAANIYLDNIKRKSAKTDAILADVERQADAILTDAEQIAEKRLRASETNQKNKQGRSGKKR